MLGVLTKWISPMSTLAHWLVRDGDAPAVEWQSKFNICWCPDGTHGKAVKGSGTHTERHCLCRPWLPAEKAVDLVRRWPRLLSAVDPANGRRLRHCLFTVCPRSFHCFSLLAARGSTTRQPHAITSIQSPYVWSVLTQDSARGINAALTISRLVRGLYVLPSLDWRPILPPPPLGFLTLNPVKGSRRIAKGNGRLTQGSAKHSAVGRPPITTPHVWFR